MGEERLGVDADECRGGWVGGEREQIWGGQAS